MNWTTSDTLALAVQQCVYCHGLGMCWTHGGQSRPCKCVFRAIFKICYRRFLKCAESGKWYSRSHYREGTRPQHAKYQVYGFRNEEYLADFIKVSRRALSEHSLGQRIFTYHYLLGADWRICCRKLGIDRGTFFHEVYRVEERLGRVYRELQPYSLWPLDEYFGGRVRSARGELLHSTIRAVEPERSSPPLRFPLKERAEAA